MDMLDKDVIETKTIDGLISPETETDFHIDSFEFENDKKLKDFDDDNNDQNNKKKNLMKTANTFLAFTIY